MINKEVLNLFEYKIFLKESINLKQNNKEKSLKKYIKTKISKYSAKRYLLLLLSIIFIVILSLEIFTFIFNKDISKRKHNNLFNAKIETKVGLCIICKRENLYIQEFVNHYKKLGYNHIFIYDNNNVDEENFDTVLKKEIEKNFVTIVDYRGRNNNRQIFEAYIDCYEKNNKNYDWLSFFDIDEFLELTNNTNIQELLDNKRYKNCQNIKFNWLIYTDNDKLYYENKPVQERFTQPLYNNKFFNQHIKSTVRGKLPKNYWINAPTPHSSDNEFIACSSSGKKIDKISPFNYPPDYSYGFLKHYRTKSIEEYCNKIKKGKADQKINYRAMINWFFSTCKITDEKITKILIELSECRGSLIYSKSLKKGYYSYNKDFI